MKTQPKLLLVLLAVLALTAQSKTFSPTLAAPPETCGVWRWGIKTLSDVDSTQVDFSPVPRTIRKLRDLEPPKSLGRHTSRVWPTEYRTYRVRARIREHKCVCCGTNDDGDYHLVLVDPRNRRRTIIAEIADPNCPGARDSAKAGALRAVREEYDNSLGQPPRGRFQEFETPPLVFITGVGFFDAVHGQKGVAPNGIEIHPVLDIERAP